MDSNSIKIICGGALTICIAFTALFLFLENKYATLAFGVIGLLCAGCICIIVLSKDPKKSPQKRDAVGSWQELDENQEGM